MATAVRASSKNSATTGTAISVAAPTGTATGDVVICTVHANTQTTIVDNNGATPFTEDINDYKPNTATGHVISVFSRRIVDGDPTTFNFTSGATGRWSIIAVTYMNPHPTVIYDVAPNTANAANTDCGVCTTTITVPPITTLTPNAIHQTFGVIDTGADTFLSWPTGYTVNETVNLNQPQSVTTKLIPSPAATGSLTYTFDGTGAGVIGVSWAIRGEVVPSAFMTTNTEFWGG